MQEAKRAERRKRIEEAAYALLAERGYGSASMLEIAKRARASNETLYQWYGDKVGLFTAMIEGNRDAAVAALASGMTGGDLAADLEAFGTALLMGVLSDRAVLLNRAAAADASGELGRALTRHGREAVMPVLAARLQREPVAPGFAGHDAMAECFVALLLGDRQIRRVLGALPAPGAAACRADARTAVARFMALCR